MHTGNSSADAAALEGVAELGLVEAAPEIAAAEVEQALTPPGTEGSSWSGVPSSDVAFPTFDAGIQALLLAQQLARAEGDLQAALLLCRAALRQLVFATLLGRGRVARDAPEAALWQAARVVPLWQEGAPATGWLTGADGWFERFVVSSDGDLALAEVPEGERAALLRRMLDQGFALARPLDRVRNAPRRAARKRRRLQLLALALIAVTSGLGLRAVLAPQNLARGKQVTLLDPDPNVPISPAGLVDGDQLALGFHTKPRKDPSVTIDLGGVHPVSRIEIFNRPDCCQERGVPLLVQISTDGQKFVEVRREKHTFYHLTVELAAPTSARYVRLVRTGSDVFHLSEVEVY